MLMLIAIGLMLAFAASPATTGGPLTAGDFRYTIKQILFAVIAAGILGGASVLSLQQLKIVAAITFAVALIGCALVLVAGTEVLGAKRSIELGLFCSCSRPNSSSRVSRCLARRSSPTVTRCRCPSP